MQVIIIILEELAILKYLQCHKIVPVYSEGGLWVDHKALFFQLLGPSHCELLFNDLIEELYIFVKIGL